VSIVIPVYNSERTIGPLVDDLVALLRPRFESFQIVLVNDGSRDHSDAVIQDALRRHPDVITYVCLTRNFGEHNAVMCGLRHIACECAVIMDDDYQNPPTEVLKLIARLEEGYDVVYSTYAHKKHSVARNLGSRMTNWVASRILDKPRGLYLSSFKALTAQMAALITAYDGPFPYLDSLLLKHTSNVASQPTDHAPRQVGASNYNLRRLVRLWLNMLTITSLGPLRAASLAGFALALLGLLLGCFFIVSHQLGGILSSQPMPPGWASLIVAITFFAAVQLFVLGCIAEYVGRLYILQNKVPQYSIRQVQGAHAPHGKRQNDDTDRLAAA
jgi:undecaprenyl-phosphate 4-deoxy-4-formamido-L-arabinose transferase